MTLIISDFWLIRPENNPPQAEWDDTMDIEQIHCPVDPAHTRGGKRLSDLHVILEDDSPEDFIRTWYSEWIIQDHVLKELREENVTGFEVRPVEARFKNNKNIPPKLWEIVVTGWGGMADPASGITLDKTRSCNACGFLRYTGATHPEKILDTKQWDGGDFFMVWPLVTCIFLSPKAKQLLSEKLYTGCNLSKASEITFSSHVIPGFGPGRLSYWMPDTRAHELGDGLGIY
ncbi:MAG: hypothetical protein ACTHLA_13755 [Asticcacaulis sp.]|uniref:hypothetical protein n=1 Tax=Asticcacaulis sp. TaxID=1872648 RepID=UPI003F7B802A